MESREESQLERAIFLAHKYEEELGISMEWYTNGTIYMFRVWGDPPNEVENENEHWEHLGAL